MELLYEGRINTAKEKTAKKAAKYTAKDSVFRDLFQNPEYLIELYQVLHPEDKTATKEDIRAVTIQNVLMDQMYNDLGFMVRGKLLVLAEAQSTWSVNIIIRILLYMADTWNNDIQDTRQNPYGSKKLEIPRPEFYVIYTGETNVKEWYSLSEQFFEGDDKFLEVKIRVLKNGKKGDILNQYVSFTKVYNRMVKEHGRTQLAVKETIQICKDQNILREYLKDREKEVMDIMTVLFDEDYLKMVYEKEIAERAELEAKQSSAIRMHKKNYKSSVIADLLDVDEQQVITWIKEADQQ